MMELTEIRKRLETSYSHLQEYESKYKIAHKEIADLKHELAIEKNSNTGLKEEMTSLKKDMTAQEQELTTLQKKFMEASTELVGAKHHIDVDGHIIAGLQDEKQALKKTVAKKIQEIQDVKRDCEATKKSLEAKLEKAETELKEEKKPLLPNTVVRAAPPRHQHFPNDTDTPKPRNNRRQLERSASRRRRRILPSRTPIRHHIVQPQHEKPLRHRQRNDLPGRIHQRA